MSDNYAPGRGWVIMMSAESLASERYLTYGGREIVMSVRGQNFQCLGDAWVSSELQVVVVDDIHVFVLEVDVILGPGLDNYCWDDLDVN